ncbi:MAG: right-handed parallel beta-helix repeat-containing protein, partial [Candidatus Omnitrophica bacterium]|nr:right-handed parallel beta-helix repeat-containing protein [Candidatus Omnitrophota bacterium]
FDPLSPDLIELPTAITIADFVDTWVNIDPMTGGITQIALAKDGTQIAVHAFGQCHPTDCDWDTVLADFTGNPFVAFYDQSFVRRTLTLYLLDRNTLQVTSENDYQDGRTDFTSTYTFVRETVWVDDDNVSEIENGTIANPFNTIQEGLAFAIYGQTVRVLPGLYTESVVMKDGVNLIGSGAEQTIIAPGLDQRSVDFIGLSDGEVLQGFTIRNAALGVYCHSSSPVIRENIITDIDYSSLSGDGIRLDDASPQILNNVIYHVGGMGIRGQSHSEPSIINNAIYDYGYYAGISFSALNIGEVYPFVINNIVVRGNTKPVGGIAWSAPAVVTVAYNTVYDPADVGTGEGSYYMYHDGTRWNEMDGGDGALNVNPLFEEASSGNFHLELDSPCIDAGHPSA